MKRNLLLGVALVIAVLCSACGKEDISEKVKLKEEQIEIGTKCNIEELFQCEEDVKIGVKNAEALNTNKVGAYSIDLTIMYGEQQVEKSYIVHVYDRTAPEIKLTKSVVELYEGENFKPEKYVSCQDNSGEKIDVSVEENNVNNKKAGEYIVKYSAQDSAGNNSTAELSVKIKKEYTYGEFLKFAKNLVKQKKYKNLRVTSDSTRKMVWIEVKDNSVFKTKKVGDKIYRYYPYWSYSKKKKVWAGSLILYQYFSSDKDYYDASSAYIKSSGGNEESDGWSREGDYDSSYVQCYDSYVSYFFKTKQSDKLAKVLSGNNVIFSSYESYSMKKTTYKASSKQMKQLNELAKIYEELKLYL